MSVSISVAPFFVTDRGSLLGGGGEVGGGWGIVRGRGKGGRWNKGKG